jgi:hypothetical protein
MTAEDAARDLCAIISDFPCAFTWNGAVYEGTRGGLVVTQAKMPGGFLEEPDFQLTSTLILADGSSRFGEAYPVAGQTFSNVGGNLARNYRVIKVTIDELDCGIQWDLESVHK